jgi:DNA-binding transcriptional LysR family regulator
VAVAEEGGMSAAARDRPADPALDAVLAVTEAMGVILAAVGTGRGFALASPTWARPLPEGMTWHRLVGDPIVRRTWAVWHADARRRDLATLVAALDAAGR